MTSSSSLHPALARMAAEYDAVTLQAQTRQISGREAKRRMLELVARDDHGVAWRIDPEDGRWRYQTKAGDWVAQQPPTSGLLLPSPADMSATSPSLAQQSVKFIPVPATLTSAGSGPALPQAVAPTLPATSRFGSRHKAVAALAATAVLAAGLVVFLDFAPEPTVVEEPTIQRQVPDATPTGKAPTIKNKPAKPKPAKPKPGKSQSGKSQSGN